MKVALAPLAGLLLACSLAPAQDTRGDLGPAVLERLAALREEHGLPAMAALVIKGGKTAGVAAVGSRRLGAPDGVTVDDPWHLGSCTKAMTATLVALLAEDGALTLETTLGDVYADQAPAMVPAWRDVTLEQLLSHRAGAPADMRFKPVGLWGTLFTNRTRTLPALRRLVVEALTKEQPELEPGSAFRYSNAGVTLAGAAAEQVTGQAYEDLLRERLFAPLGMSGAGFGPPGGLDAPRGHRTDGDLLVAVEPDGVAADNPAAIAPAGTAHAPLEDWAQFALLHLRGARGEEGLLLDPASFRGLHRARGPEGYALGWGVGAFPAGGRVITHSGSNTMWFATVVLAPDDDAAVLVVTNCGGPRAERACGAAVVSLLELARG